MKTASSLLMTMLLCGMLTSCSLNDPLIEKGVSVDIAKIANDYRAHFLLRERSFHTASTLSNGTVLILGGCGTGPSSSVEIYNPLTGVFTAAGSMTDARAAHTTSVLSDGKVFIYNGYGAGNGFWEILNPHCE